MRGIVRLAGIVGLALTLGVTGALGAEKMGKFKIKDDKGAEVTQELLKKAETTVFVVAQTACNQCRSELRAVNERLDDILAKKAAVYTLLVDSNEAVGLERYVKAGLKIPALMDPGFTVPALVGIDVTPATIIVDKDGNVKLKKTGFRDADIDKILENL